MKYYRCEVSYQNRKPHGIFQWVFKIREQMAYLEEWYYQKYQKNEDDRYLILSDECSQDFDWLEEIMAHLEDHLIVPPIQICKQGRCAYTEEGYKKFAESLDEYKYIAGKYGYYVEIKEIQPEKILYQDDMQIVFRNLTKAEKRNNTDNRFDTLQIILSEKLKQENVNLVKACL